MSTKSLRLVLEERERTKPQSDEEEDSEHEETTGHKKNLFELLNDECEDEKDQIEETHSVQESSNKKKNKRKKKNKKNKDTTQLEADKKPNEDEDIDSIIKEVNEFASNSSTKVSQDKGTIFKSCFTVEMRHLNPDNEVKRLFGNRILLNEKNNKKQRNVKRYQLITADFNKQSVLRKSGLSMDVVKKRDGKTEFVFVHSRSYQEAQKAFMEVVKSNNHENLIKLLEGYPFHIDALQQMSDLFRLQEDLQQATQSIEYALFVFEASFHPLFSLTSASSRLDYRRRENRSFFLVLFRHVCLLSNKSLHRTALEVAKLILSLSPDSDPLGILLMLDHLCLKAEQHCFLTRLYTEWHACKNLFQLPNFAFSTPLAYFFISKSSSSSSSSSSETSRSFDVVSREEAASKADEMLRDALLMYPCLLLRLLDKLSVQADAQVSSHAHFQQDFHSEPKALCMLLDLYIWRSGEVWKKKGVMEWMERNVRQVVNGWESFKDTAEYYKKLRTARYKGTPRNIYRHVVLSEARSVVPDIPEFLMSSVEGYDPLPPPDSIQAYDPTPSSDSRTGQSRSGFLSLFFQSLSPSFNQNDTTEGAERPGWVGHLVGGVRHLLHNDHGLFQRLYRRGEEDDEDGGDGGDDNDGDVPRRQNWDEEDASGGGEGSAREGGARGGGGREGGAGGGGGLRRRIINSGRAVDEDDVDNDNNDNSNNSNSNNDNNNNNNNNNDDVNGVGRDGS